MGSDITLSSAVRNNLLSLQKTADLLGATQERLATGLKVNSALDDPTAFFTASALNNRASDLDRLQDFVGNAVQTLRAADEGITAITNLVEAAEATARQALQSAGSTQTASTATGTATIAADAAAVALGTGLALTANTELDTLANITAGDTLTIQVGANASYTIEFDTDTTPSGTNDISIDILGANDADGGGDDATVTDLLNAISNATGATAVLSGGNIQITAGDTTSDILITGSDAGVVADLGFTSVGEGSTTARTIEPSNSDFSGLTGDLTFQIGTGTVNTISFGTDDSANEVSNRAELLAEINSITGLSASYSSNILSVESTDTTSSFTVGGDTAELAAVNLTAGLVNPGVESTNTDRSNFAAQFDELRTQINELSVDAGYNGVNLLAGDSLTVTFNEDGTSSLGISGVTFDASGLGISTADNNFQLDLDINNALTELDTATNTLRSQATKFGSNLSVVETRQDFTKELINVLETGAANLTLADTNEEGANLLALQTRQQLSSTALSLASQADQNVLRLF
ncbi:MAG: flagellin [Methyloligellaceae bacterium]